MGLGTVAVTAGWALLTGPPPLGDAGVVPSVAASAAAPADGHTPSPPREIRGPGGFRAALLPVAATTDGVLALPGESDSGGWWALGASAGAAAGTVLIAGHVDTHRAGLGAFAALHGFRVGAEVQLVAANGHTYPYVVTARRTYPQHKLPRDLFTRQGAHRAALVTCTGTYDHTTGSYDRNLVLYATPAPA